jgi:hypothetical protein
MINHLKQAMSTGVINGCKDQHLYLVQKHDSLSKSGTNDSFKFWLLDGGRNYLHWVPSFRPLTIYEREREREREREICVGH